MVSCVLWFGVEVWLELCLGCFWSVVAICCCGCCWVLRDGFWLCFLFGRLVVYVLGGLLCGGG